MQQLREQTAERHLLSHTSGDCSLSISKCIYILRAFTVGEVTLDVFPEHIMHYVLHGESSELARTLTTEINKS
jgi:hypothetical protein